MAGRGRTSYQKKLKEQVRLERRQQKAAKMQARKAAKSDGTLEPDSDLEVLSPEESAFPAGNGQESQ